MLYTPFRQALRIIAGGLALAALTLVCGPVWANCSIGKVADLPVTMLGMSPLLVAKINGQDAAFVVGSGTTFSMITAPNAEKFKLPRQELPFGVFVSSVTGDIAAAMGVVDVLTLANTPLRRMEFIVGGGEVGEGAVGILGQNILGNSMWNMTWPKDRSVCGKPRDAAAATWPIGQR